MDGLNDALKAITDLTVEAIVAGCAKAEEIHSSTRTKGHELRSQAAAIALLGPKLYQVGSALAEEATGKAAERFRKTLPRPNATLAHPRRASGPAIDELEDAEASFNSAVLLASAEPGFATTWPLILAGLRVRAIARALGDECVAEPARGSSPQPRRRTITASDVDPRIAALVLGATSGPESWATALDELAAIANSTGEHALIANKLLGLAGDRDRGPAHFNVIARRLRVDGFEPSAQVPETARPTPVSVSPSPASPRTAVAPRPAYSNAPVDNFVKSASSDDADARPGATARPTIVTAPGRTSTRTGSEQHATKPSSIKERLAERHRQRRSDPR